MVILEPGQVLLVPSGWWHYVESVDLSISVNVWLPLPADHRSRLGEAIVKLLVNEIGKGNIPTSDESTLEFNETVRLVNIACFILSLEHITESWRVISIALNC